MLIAGMGTDGFCESQPAPSDIHIPAVVIVPGTDCIIPERVRQGLPECPPMVPLPTYAIGKYEVTNEEYLDFVQSGGYQVEEFWSPEGWYYRQKNNWTAPINWPFKKVYRQQQEKMPVAGISWYEAQAYCCWLTYKDPGHVYRLPTELEWLYAATGPDFTAWPWGDEWDPKRCNFCDRLNNSWYPSGEIDGFKPLAPVGSFENGKSRFGCYDMVGNAEEWCLDWYDRHGLSEIELARRIIEDPHDLYKVFRGGSWITARPENLLPSRRAGTYPFVRRIFFDSTGFRVCYTVGQALK
jgi:formylglycine-generating enzyme required for sulfatase activity